MPDYRPIDTVVYREGGRLVTIQKVEPPDLPDRPEPPPPPALSDEEIQARLAALRKDHKATQLALVSATVYNRAKTLLRWWIAGSPERKFEAWSNIDVNYLTGFGSFEVGGVQYGLLMGIGNVDTEAWSRRMAEAGRDHEEPTPPELPADRPAYVLTEGDAKDQEGIAMIDGLHKLYKCPPAPAHTPCPIPITTRPDDATVTLMAGPPSSSGSAWGCSEAQMPVTGASDGRGFRHQAQRPTSGGGDAYVFISGTEFGLWIAR